MEFSTSERIAVFIDGAELRAAVGGIGIDVDFKKLRALFEGVAKLGGMLFYHIDREDDEEDTLRPLIDWLDYNGYRTVACSGRETDAISRRGNKGFVNVRLTVDALEMAAGVDHIVIFSGDAVLGPLVDALKWRGKRVSIVSTLQLRPPLVADNLRRRADQFIDLADIIEHIAKDHVSLGTPRRGPRSVGRAVHSARSTSPQKEVDASTS